MDTARTWPRGLRRGSATARLRVRILPEALMSVSFECCVGCQVATGRSIGQTSPAECGVSEYDRAALVRRKLLLLARRLTFWRRIFFNFSTPCI